MTNWTTGKRTTTDSKRSTTENSGNRNCCNIILNNNNDNKTYSKTERKTVCHENNNNKTTANELIRLTTSGIIFTIIILTGLVEAQTTDTMTVMKSDHLNVTAFTWNVANSDTHEDFTQALGLNGNLNNLPHVYVFGFEEVPVRISYLVLEDPLIEHLKHQLKKYNYVKLKATKLQGILIVAFVKRDLLTRTREIETSYLKTGFNGMWGNKGGTALRFTIAGSSVALVTTHLAAHDHMLDRRIQDYKDIVHGIEFKNRKTNRILDHDHVILMGDLNFRINDYTAQEIYDRITEGSESSRDQLLQKDQLNQVRSQGIALTEFNESKITFWPTYKFKVDSNIYDIKKRKPAYTDRILFKIGDDNISQRNYGSHMNFMKSDHKPVSAQFTIKLPSRRLRTTRDAVDHKDQLDDHHHDVVVDFRPIGQWDNNDDEKRVHFAFRDRETGNNRNSEVHSKLRDRDWDWIAVIPADFDSLDQWISYAWVNESVLRDGDLIDSPQDPSPGFSGEETVSQRGSGSHFTLRFDPILNPGSTYRLIYFHGQHSTSVLGVSDSFDVVGEQRFNSLD